MTEISPELYWRKNAYIPYNHLLPILVQKPGWYERAWLEKHVRKTYGYPKGLVPTATQQEVLDWLRTAKQALVRTIAQAGLDGSAPKRPFGSDFMEVIARWLCSLPLPTFHGELAPRAIFRWTPNAVGGSVIDIVPADPRLGYDEIPDWSEPDPLEKKDPAVRIDPFNFKEPPDPPVHQN